MRAKQLNKLSPPSLLYANNYYSSLDSFIFFLFFNLCFPGLFCPPLAPQILWDTFFILIDFDSRVIDLMWSSCFSGVTDATFAMAMPFPSPLSFPENESCPVHSSLSLPSPVFLLLTLSTFAVLFVCPVFLRHLPHGVTDMPSCYNCCHSNMTGFPISAVCKANSRHQSGKRRCNSI